MEKYKPQNYSEVTNENKMTMSIAQKKKINGTWVELIVFGALYWLVEKSAKEVNESGNQYSMKHLEYN